MENSWKPIKLSTINWPVFRLGENRPEQENSKIFYRAEYSDKDSNEYFENIRLIDDTSIDKPTLGLRRLALRNQHTLFRIGTAIYSLVDLLKLAKHTTWFIDSYGQVFQHKKSTRAKLVTRRIKQVLPAAGLGCVLEIEGLSQRFKALTRPESHQKWAGLLLISGGYLFYGYYDTPIDPTWRLV